MNHADLSRSAQFLLIGLLAVACLVLVTRAMIFFRRERAGVRPMYPIDLEYRAMPGPGIFSAADWPRTNPAVGVLSFYRPIDAN